LFDLWQNPVYHISPWPDPVSTAPSCAKMETPLKRFLIILLFLLLTGCTIPTGNLPEPVTQCAYVEGRKDSPKLLAQFTEKMKTAGLPVKTVRTEAYGENCVAADGTVVSFSQREIDFYVTLNVPSLKDEMNLGSQLEQILLSIEQLSPDEVGPNPGYVGVTFESGKQVQNLWFTLFDANALLAQGTKGAALYEALLKKP
jgi:hypothetical protein